MTDELKFNWKKYVSKEPPNPIEYIVIFLTLILIIVIIYASNKQVCELDCSMCIENAKMLIQRGFK